MPGPEVMLATSSKLPAAEAIEAFLAAGGWWGEVKLDGIRAVVTRARSGAVVITNRRQADITHRYPDVVARLAEVDFVGVLDGEIVVLAPTGRPVFSLAHLRDSQSRPARIAFLAGQHPATFMPFDVLEVAGKDVRAEAYTSRRTRLATVFSGERDLWAPASTDLHEMWSAVQDLGLEGLMVKKGSSRYYPGKRHPSWVKLKATRRLNALVGGVVAGKGSRGSVGALELYLFDPDAGALVAIGKVGSGIRDADAVIISRALKAGSPVVVQVEFLEVAPSGLLRMPTFKGVRTDVAPESCTINTLGI